MKILALYRAPQFSPNSVEKDHAILSAVVSRMRRHGDEVVEQSETAPIVLSYEAGELYDFVLSMGRLSETLARLKHHPHVINSSQSLERCSRSYLRQLALHLNLPVAPSEGNDGYWLKRGDACAQTSGDVVYAKDRETLAACLCAFQERGISDYVVSAHVVGDLVKFYGVRGTGFFRFFYPTDDGQSKFGDEQRNGVSHHFPFVASEMHAVVERLADATGLDVYGGDCIVRSDGTFCLIDFNDWPSFSRCREDAADAIASLII